MSDNPFLSDLSRFALIPACARLLCIAPGRAMCAALVALNPVVQKPTADALD
jgi:hypothetical protein